jgi:hypothetical protein
MRYMLVPLVLWSNKNQKICGSFEIRGWNITTHFCTGVFFFCFSTFPSHRFSQTFHTATVTVTDRNQKLGEKTATATVTVTVTDRKPKT